MLKKLTVAVLLCTLALAGCMSAPEEYIQGDWYYDHNPHRLEIDHQPANDIESWTFSSGSYHTASCCLHVGNESGYYNVVEFGEDWITLDLAIQRGGEPHHQIKIKIDAENDLIYFGRMTYQRGMP